MFQYFTLALAIASALGAVIGLFSANRFIKKERILGYITCPSEYLIRALCFSAASVFLVAWAFWVWESVANVLSK